MKPLFHPALVNDSFGDPGLYIDFLFERRALLFDLGELTPLPPRKLLRVSHIFVSHTHVDHFIGFDHLLRICLGRDKKIHLYGPPGFVDQIWHRLAAYTWNLVQNYPTDFTVVATELHPDGKGMTARFHCRRGFAPEQVEAVAVHDGVLLDEQAFRVRAAFLDHRIPCLAFALEEKSHVNIMKNRLAEMGLQVGPWLTELKAAVLGEEPDDLPFRAWWREEGRIVEQRIPLGELKREILRIVPGQKIAYVTDTAYTLGNAERIVELAAGADYLFIEATFLQEEEARAAEKRHLTARQAGILAREAGAVRVIPIHFSPKYMGKEELLRREVEEAFAGYDEEKSG
ncbi:MAG TPA: MBL fold metallo-hydrolase [Geobacteraceae bacterium]